MNWIWELCGLVGGLVGLIVIIAGLILSGGFGVFMLKGWLYRKGWIS